MKASVTLVKQTYGNDILATGAITKATEMGLKPLDDIDLAEVIQPKLTTLHVPHWRMSEAAAQILLDILDGKTECQSIEIET